MFTSDNFPRLSNKEFIILEMLVNRGDLYGLEIVTLSDGEIKRGTVYVTLQRMMEKSFVESIDEQIQGIFETGDLRHRYRITDFGRIVFKSQELALRYLNMNLGS